MSTTPTPPTERDAQMLSIGTQCSLPSCHTVDFLPFKCAHCTSAFCAEHYIPKSHSCAKYDEHAHDRVAPDCPMCNKPVAIPPGADPNARMEAHFARECAVMLGRAAQVKKSPTCSNKKCGKTLIVPIQCSTCRQQFCPTHRFPNTHTCTPTSTPTPGRSGSNTPAQSAAAVAAAVAAAKRQASAKASKIAAKAQSQLNSATSASSSAPKEAGPAKLKTPLPFSAMDRRARAERASRHRAMAERAKKGLLSEEEKVIFAAEEAEQAEAKAKGKEGDCVVQ